MTMELAKMTAEVVKAHLSTTPMPSGEVPAFMKRVQEELSSIASDVTGPDDGARPALPAEATGEGLVDDRWPGVFADRVVCLEDGRPCKLLKSYVSRKYGMTPDEYRRRWRLPADYPFTPADYAASKRSAALDAGLGRTIRSR